jgi:hypothetical protein
MIYRLLPPRKPKEEVEEPATPSVGSWDHQFRGLFSGVLGIVGLVIVTLLVLLLFLHSRFMGQVAECRQAYLGDPNMRIIKEEPPYFLQPFGSLTTELHSTESAEQVQDRLNRARAALQREAVVSGDFSNLPEQTWTVLEAEDGGSRIMLTCP